MKAPAPCPTCPHLEDDHGPTGCKLCACGRDPIRAARHRRRHLRYITGRTAHARRITP